MSKQIRACAACSRIRMIEGRNLCGGCYNSHRASGTLDLFPRARQGRKRGNSYACLSCELVTVLAGRGLCSPCYFRHRRRGTLDQFAPAIEKILTHSDQEVGLRGGEWVTGPGGVKRWRAGLTTS